MGETAKMQYSNQLILCLVPGGRDRDEDNQSAYNNALALDTKRTLAGESEKSRCVTLSAMGTPDLTKLQNEITESTRVYIVGHGTAESSSIGDLDAEQLASMLKTLVQPPKRIRRLGLVGCFSAISKLSPNRPVHRLAAELFQRVGDRVDEITGYTGEVGANWSTTTKPADNTVQVNRLGKDFGGTVNAGPGTGRKIVTQQRTEGGTEVPRKVIVTADRITWAPAKTPSAQ